MKIGVAGLGIMGQAFTDRYLGQGCSVAIWNRTASKTSEFLELGAEVADTPANLASRSDITITSLKDDPALLEVSLGQDGILQGMAPGAIHCDTSTILPETAETLSCRYREMGKLFVHAPVLGSKKQISEGALLVFTCCQVADRARLELALTMVSSRIWWLEAPGQPAALKLACNALIASLICSLSQSLTFGNKLGVPPEVLMDVINHSALACPMFQNKSRQILNDDFRANFVVDNLVKDINTILTAADSSGVPLPLLAAMQQFFRAASSSGYGQEDYSAVCKVFEQMAGAALTDRNETNR